MIEEEISRYSAVINKKRNEFRQNCDFCGLTNVVQWFLYWIGMRKNSRAEKRLKNTSRKEGAL